MLFAHTSSPLHGRSSIGLWESTLYFKTNTLERKVCTWQYTRVRMTWHLYSYASMQTSNAWLLHDAVLIPGFAKRISMRSCVSQVTPNLLSLNSPGLKSVSSRSHTQQHTASMHTVPVTNHIVIASKHASFSTPTVCHSHSKQGIQIPLSAVGASSCLAGSLLAAALAPASLEASSVGMGEATSSFSNDCKTSALWSCWVSGLYYDRTQTHGMSSDVYQSMWTAHQLIQSNRVHVRASVNITGLA